VELSSAGQGSTSPDKGLKLVDAQSDYIAPLLGVCSNALLNEAATRQEKSLK